MNPKFHYEAIKAYINSFNDHTSELLQGLKTRLDAAAAAKLAPSGQKRPSLSPSSSQHDGSVIVDMVDAFSRLTLDIICDAGFGHASLHSVRHAACMRQVPGGGNHQTMEPMLKDEGGDGGYTQDCGDEISVALRSSLREIAKRLSDPLRILKYLPHRYRKTWHATQVLRKVIEKAVADRKVQSTYEEMFCLYLKAVAGEKIHTYFFPLF